VNRLLVQRLLMFRTLAGLVLVSWMLFSQGRPLIRSAERQIGFHLRLPRDLPSGFRLTQVDVSTESDRLKNSVRLIYTGRTGIIEMNEYLHPMELVPNEGDSVETTIVDGQQITVVTTHPTAANSPVFTATTATIEVKGVYIQVTGMNISKEEVLKVIRSF